jgi:hypothetical protein
MAGLPQVRAGPVDQGESPAGAANRELSLSGPHEALCSPAVIRCQLGRAAQERGPGGNAASAFRSVG